MYKEQISGESTQSRAKGICTRLKLNGRYRPLAARQGGMGMIIFCEDQLEHKKVALKTFHPDFLSSRFERMRFIEEAANWIFLGYHPNIVRANRVEQMGDPAYPYLVMDWIQGASPDAPVSLADHIRARQGEPFSPRQILWLCIQITRAMRFASERIEGLVHRDLKPSNLLIDKDNVAYVTDFGLARAFTPTDHAGRKKSVQHVQDIDDFTPPGSPAYVAPEAWQPDYQVESQADIYALGLIMLEMVTGQQPVQVKNKAQARRQHLDGIDLSVIHSVPAPLLDVIEIATARTAEDRFANWSEFEQATNLAYSIFTAESAPHEEVVSMAEDIQREIISYQSIGNSFADLAYHDAAFSYLDRAYQLAADAGDVISRVSSCQALARVLVTQGKVARAAKELEATLEIANQENSETTDVARLLAMLGNIYANLGDASAAQLTLSRAFNLAEELDEYSLQTIILGGMANAYAHNAQFEEAISCFRSQLMRFEKCQDIVGRSTCLTNLGAAYIDARRPEEATEVLSDAWDFAVNERLISDRARVLQLLCEAAVGQKDYQQLEMWTQRYRDFCVQADYREGLEWLASVFGDRPSP